MIPFEGRPEQLTTASAPRRRAARYGAADVAEQIQSLKSQDCEGGLNGIDAWPTSSSRCDELEEIRRVTGTQDSGVRMHWLYQDERTPVKLEQAGADYDSTVGYNDTVGFRAGTTQVYKPLATNRLLELPLHVMDTALFYPRHLGLSPRSQKPQHRPRKVVGRCRCRPRRRIPGAGGLVRHGCAGGGLVSETAVGGVRTGQLGNRRRACDSSFCRRRTRGLARSGTKKASWARMPPPQGGDNGDAPELLAFTRREQMSRLKRTFIRSIKLFGI